MTRSVDRSKAANYLKKVDGALRMARMAVMEGEFDVAVMNSIHGAINAMAALTTVFLGKRASGAHTETLSLAKEILNPNEFGDVHKQFGSLMGMKNESEYQPTLMSRQDAENAVKWAERIISKVKEKLASRAGSEP